MLQSNYITGLTPLRGIAAFFVMMLHYNILIAALYPAGASSIADNLYLMVDLFFVLSGFIMYHVYGNYFSGSIRKAAYVGFMKARFARIYPLHLFTFLFTVAVFLIYIFSGAPTNAYFSIVFDRTAIPSQLLLTQAMGTHHEATWNAPSWSISVEWWAYVLFPFLMVFLTHTKVWSRVVIAAVILGGYLLITYYAQSMFWAERWKQMNIPAHVPYPVHTLDVITGPSAFLRCMCGFMGGMLVYEGFRKGWGKSWLQRGFVFPGLWVILIISWHFNGLPHYLAPLFFSLIILSAAYNNGRLSKILNSRGFQFVGDISYSLYLVHMPLLFAYVALRTVLVPNDPKQLMFGYSFSLLEAWIGLFIFTGATIAVASITYYFVEKPARTYLNRKRQAAVIPAVVMAAKKEKSGTVGV